MNLLLSGSLLATTPNSTFFWGVANSAFQVEGQPQASDWRSFTQQPGAIADGSHADFITNFWTDFEKDFALAQKLGANAFRLSIAWERIEPTPGNYDLKALDHYEKMLLSARRHGLEPIVTLHHFVLPEWLSQKGGLLEENFPQRFENYAAHVVSHLSKGPARVRWWMTFNEPNVLVRGGYMEGDWPPQKKDFNLAVQALAQLSRAHLRAVNQMRKIRSDLHIGIAQHWRVFQAKNKWNPLDQLAKWISDWCWNRQSTRSMYSGQLNLWLPGAQRVREEITINEKQLGLDYLGLNYYGRSVVSFRLKAPFIHVEEGNLTKSDIGWELYPEGMEQAIQESYKDYALPVLIAENGLADAKDQLRPNFLTSHLASLQNARNQKLPVIGYLHWTLTDNFEWHLGRKPRFGLVEVNDTTGKREPRPSFETYRKWIEAHP